MPPIFLRLPETPGRGPQWAGLAGALFIGCLAAAFAATLWLSGDLSRREPSGTDPGPEFVVERPQDSRVVRPWEPGGVDDPLLSGAARSGGRSDRRSDQRSDRSSDRRADRSSDRRFERRFILPSPSSRAGLPPVWEEALVRVEEARMQKARVSRALPRVQTQSSRTQEGRGRDERGQETGQGIGSAVEGPFEASLSGPRRPRLAIVIDDWGYPWEAADDMLALPVPLTVAVLPHLPYTEAHAEAALRQGHEVILHLPLQALGTSVPAEPGTIRVDMSPAQVVQATAAALESVPQAVGVSNHQGSRATADRSVMYPLLAELKRRGLFYLDSYTNSQTRGPEAAYVLGVPFAVNRIFIDHDPDEEAVVARLRQAIDLARDEGHAIAIGHVRRATQRALARMLPEFEAAGIELVTASRLIGLPGSGSRRVQLPAPPEYARAWRQSLLSRGTRPREALSPAALTSSPADRLGQPWIRLRLPISQFERTERPVSTLDPRASVREPQGKGS